MLCKGLYLYPLTTNEFLNVYENFSGKITKNEKAKDWSKEHSRRLEKKFFY